MSETLLYNIDFKTNFSEKNIIDSSEKKCYHLIVTEKGKHLKVSPTSYFLLKSYQDKVPVSEIAAQLNVPIKDIESSCQTLLKKISEINESHTVTRKGFWFLLKLIPSAYVSIFARPLSVLFNPALVITNCILVLIAIALSVHSDFFSNSFTSIKSPEVFWIGYCLFFLSVIIHEFGHASASVRYGAEPSDIGFTFYLIFPALYSDVTSSWKLQSIQRAIVGLGGIYFQLLVATLYIFLGITTGNASFKTATFMILGNCILNLNPFFKFDGYWILSDFLGVVNLSEQPKKIIKFFYNSVCGKTTESLPWNKWIALAIVFYSIGSVLMISLFLVVYSSYFWSKINLYPKILQHFLTKLFLDNSITYTEVHDFFLSTLSIIIFSYFLYNIIFKVAFYKLKSILRDKELE